MQGAQLHGFRVVRRGGQLAVECALCNQQFNSQSGRHFLNNYFKRHVFDLISLRLDLLELRLERLQRHGNDLLVLVLL